LGNFQQHITCSTATGIAIGGLAYCFGFEPPACLVAAGLCSFAGMLPDIDSDSSTSFRECIYLAASIGCILTISRLRQHDGIDTDFAMFGGAMMLLFIRFGVGSWIKKITTHRGMIHSIPMAIISGQLAFFAVTGTLEERILKASALAIGFLSHLVLDEVYSVDSTGAKLRLKKSFGTALKWTNPKQPGPVAIIYASIFCLGCAVFMQPDVIERRNGSVELAEKTPTSDASVKQRDIQREAAEFLVQQGPVSTVLPPYTRVAELPPFAPVLPEPVSVLPAAMQIGNDWNQNVPLQPARIVIQ